MLFPNGDVEALAARISQLVEDRALRERMSAAALLQAERFDEGGLIDQYVALFESVLAGRDIAVSRSPIPDAHV